MPCIGVVRRFRCILPSHNINVEHYLIGLQALRQHNVKVVCIHPAAVNTPMTEGMFVPERCLQPSDIAEAAMLALRVSSSCVPSEITLRLTLSAAK